MNRSTRDFLRSTAQQLDEFLATLPDDQQHEFLDQLAADVEERLDALADRAADE